MTKAYKSEWDGTLVDAADGPCFVREIELVYVGVPTKMEPLQSSDTVNREVRKLLPDGPREHFLVFMLDAKNRPIGFHKFSGGLSTVGIEPGDLFRPVLVVGARSIILVHNHPSGDPTPSPKDIALTERIVRAGELLGVRVLDHVIVATENHFSFLDTGMIG